MSSFPSEYSHTATLTSQAVASLVAHWYFLLDVHAPVSEIRALLSPESLEMRFPEGTLTTLAQFDQWYDRVIHIFFDEVHDLQKVDVKLASDGRTADVTIVVRWLARRWKAPVARSEWLCFNAAQRWTVAMSASGRPVITHYIVDSLTPIADSAAL